MNGELKKESKKCLPQDYTLIVRYMEVQYWHGNSATSVIAMEKTQTTYSELLEIYHYPDLQDKLIISLVEGLVIRNLGCCCFGFFLKFSL